MKESKVRKILAFLGLCLCAMGFIGGIGYSIHGGGYPIAVGVVVLGAYAFPKMRDTWGILVK